MHVLLTCKNEVDQIKNEGADFSHYKYMGIFPDAQGQLTPQSLVRSLVRDFMGVLITCQYEKDPIKNRGARVFTTLYIIFSDAQGQITLELVVVSGRKALEFSQHFPHNNPMEAIRCHGHQSSDPIWPKT